MRRLTSFTKKSLISRDGVKLYYEQTGKSKEVLFFVHGLGGDVAAWDEERIFFDQLGYSTLALDLRGHGFSAHPPDREGYSLAHFAYDIADVLQHEGIRKFVLIGHCFGAIVAYRYAQLLPDSADALILISASYRQPYMSHHSPIKKVLHAMIKAVVPISSKKYVPRHADYAMGGFEHDFEPLGLYRVIKHNSLKTYLSLTDEVFSLDVLDEFQKITIPTLLITGSNDTIYPSWMSEKIHTLIKNSELVRIDKGNHPVVLNNAMEVSVAAATFLQKNPF